MTTGSNYNIQHLGAILRALGLGDADRSKATPHPMNTSYATRWEADGGLYVFADVDVCYVQMADDDPRCTAVEVAAGAPAGGLQVRSSWATPDGTVMTVLSRTAQDAVVITNGGARRTYAHSSAANWRLVRSVVPQAEWDEILETESALQQAYDATCRRHRRERQERPRWGSISLAELGRRQTRGEDISGVMG